MGTSQRTPDGERVRNGVVKTVTGYMQPMRPGDDRMTKSGARIVRRSVRVPIKDHPKGGEFHQVQTMDERLTQTLADVPERAQVRVSGSAKVDRWVKADGSVQTTEIVWADSVEVIALFQGQPQSREDW
jgi:hypothetical protein